MISLTKQTITPEQIQLLANQCFGGTQKLGRVQELTGGWFNAAYSVELPDLYLETVLRIAPHPDTRLLTYEKDLMQREVQIYRRLSESGLPVPILYGYSFQRDLLDRDYMFISKLQGQPLDQVSENLTQPEKDDLDRQLGELTARIHQIQGERYGYDQATPEPHNQAWRTAFLHMIGSVLNDSEALGVELPRPSIEIGDLFQAASPLLKEIKQPRLVHWDLWAPNIFVKRQNGRWLIEAITDHERAFWGDPEAEYIFAFKDHNSPFFEGYQKSLDLSEAAQQRRKMYLMYLLLVMVVEAKTRQFDQDGHVTWAFQELDKNLRELEITLQPRQRHG